MPSGSSPERRRRVTSIAEGGLLSSYLLANSLAGRQRMDAQDAAVQSAVAKCLMRPPRPQAGHERSSYRISPRQTQNFILWMNWIAAGIPIGCSGSRDPAVAEYNCIQPFAGHGNAIADRTSPGQADRRRFSLNRVPQQERCGQRQSSRNRSLVFSASCCSCEERRVNGGERDGCTDDEHQKADQNAIADFRSTNRATGPCEVYGGLYATKCSVGARFNTA